MDLIDACELGTTSAFSPAGDSGDGIGSLRITGGGRKRWAGKSSWGGRRPYGRMIDPAAPRRAKRLITVPEEAKVIQDAVTDILDRGISLRAVAADLRQRGLRTSTGKPFTAGSLRDALLSWYRSPRSRLTGQPSWQANLRQASPTNATSAVGR